MTVLCQVNGAELDLKEALMRISALSDPTANLVHHCIEEILIREYAAQNGIANSDEELQVATDELRYQRRLELVEDLQQWMKSKYQTFSSLQDTVDIQLLRNKTLSSVPLEQVQEYFAEHKQDFDEVELYTILVDSLQKAQELYSKITQGESFYLLALEHSLDERSNKSLGYLGKVTRHYCPPEVQEAVFNASLGEVLPPLQTKRGYQLYKITGIFPANFQQCKSNIEFEIASRVMEGLRDDAEIIFPEVLS